MIFNKCTLMIIFQFNPQITVLCDNNFLAEIKKILFYYPVKKNPPPPKKNVITP